MSPMTEKTQNEIKIECESCNQLCTIQSEILNKIVTMIHAHHLFHNH